MQWSVSKYASSSLYISTFTETTNQLSVFVPPECEYEQRVYADGEIFSPSGGGPCLQCRCKASLCNIHPKKVCVQCKNLFVFSLKRRHDSSFVSCIFLFQIIALFMPINSFDISFVASLVQSGNVICNEEKCPPVRCSNPIRHPHLCCPVCKSNF